MLFKEKKSFTKLQLPFALALSLANFFAFSKTSVKGGVVTLFKENLYFIRIFKLLVQETLKLILHLEQLT